MDVNLLVLGVIVSSIGMGMVIYGRKTVRLPPLIIGLVLTLLPFLLSTVLGLSVISVCLLAAAYLLREQ